MVRTQIQLTEEQVRALRVLAASRGQSMAEVIRQALDRMLSDEAGSDSEELHQRALEAAGRFRSGLGDLSVEHDRYLEDAFAQ